MVLDSLSQNDFMKFYIFFLLIHFVINRAKAQVRDPFNKDVDTASYTGTIIEVKDTLVFGVNTQYLTVINKKDSITLNLYNLREATDLLHKQVRISYNIYKTYKEVDMFINDTSVYYDRKSPKDLSKTTKVKGFFEIYDYGCAMPGIYSITSPKEKKTWISHYIEEKYQAPFEGNIVSVYYTTEIHNNITKISFIEPPSTNRLNAIPSTFFKQIGISRFEIATKEKNFNSGCVRKPSEKHVLLNYVKTNKDNNTQVISLSFGGKRFYTKEYLLSYKKGKLQIKEKTL